MADCYSCQDDHLLLGISYLRFMERASSFKSEKELVVAIDHMKEEHEP